MFEVFKELMNEAETLVRAAALIVCIVGVIATYGRTKALVPTIGAVLLGAIVMFGVTNFEEIGREIDQDMDRRQEKHHIDTGNSSGG